MISLQSIVLVKKNQEDKSSIFQVFSFNVIIIWSIQPLPSTYIHNSIIFIYLLTMRYDYLIDHLRNYHVETLMCGLLES